MPARPHTQDQDTRSCVIHAGTGKVHKLRYVDWTECGEMTTFMSRLDADELDDSHLCRHCFHVT